MNEEATNNVFRLLLKYLNLGKKTFKFSELDSASDDDVAITDLSDVVRKMTEDKILRKSGMEQYDIAVDIGVFRYYILAQTEREVDEESCKTPIDIIMDSSWTSVKPNKQTAHKSAERVKNVKNYEEDSDSNGDYYTNGKDYKNRMKNLEAPNHKFMHRRQESFDEDDDGETENWEFEEDDYEDNKELYRDALKFCIKRRIASISLIQSHFPIGYIRACKIIDWMEDNDFISQQLGSKPRRILIGRKDFENIFGVPFDEKEEETEESEGDSALDRFLKRRANEQDRNEQDRKNAAQNLVNVLSRIAEKKNAPITCKTVPNRSLWNDKDFEEAVVERLERIIKSDRRMGREGAIKKAETYLEAVRDTHDRKMVQVYERIVYELKCASDYNYRQLKKQFFDEGE